jgi:DNA segregation ATPase FtsK/SpoIIIE-like protein
MKYKQTLDPARFPPLQDHTLKIGLGSFLILLTLLGLINQGIIAFIINVFFGFLIGQLRFLGYVFFIGYGLALILNRPFLKLRWSVTTFGMIMTFLSFLALATLTGIRTLDPVPALTISSVMNEFFTIFPPIETGVIILPEAIGGGLIGYGLIASITTFGLAPWQEVIWLAMMILGIAFSLEILWLSIIRYGAKQLDVKQKERQFFQKIATTNPKNAKAGVYAETDDQHGELRTFRALFPGQTVKGLSKVPFQKPTGATLAKANQSGFQIESNKPTLTASLSSVYEAPEVPSQVIPTMTTPPLQRPSFTKQPTPSTSHQSTPSFSTTTNRYQAYQLPPVDMLDARSSINDIEFNEQMTKIRVDTLHQKFMALGVEATIVGYQIGPAVTAFDIKMAEGSQISEVKRIIGDLAVALGGFQVTLKELVPGKTVSQLEVLNERISMVGYRELVEDLRKQSQPQHRLVIPFGRNILGEVVSLTPKEIIHMLVAGQSGSGKTVFMHALITSILMSSTPNQSKILLVDPKKFELSKYKNLPHLLCPIISDVQEAKVAIERLIDEMESRYEKFLDTETISIETYNQHAMDHQLDPLPLIFAIIDEYNDLINVNPQISDLVQRIAQKSRAAGIHLVIATQRPTTNILTGSIKNNLATIVALRVSKQVDSITMLGHAGAEVLGGNGDMYLVNPLFSRYGEIRVQAAYISDAEIQRICAYIRSQALPDYNEKFLNLIDKTSQFQDASGLPSSMQESLVDSLYSEIKQAASNRNYVSMSWISRTYSTGYPRALKIFKQLQQEGIIDASLDNPNNNRGRKVLVNPNFKEDGDDHDKV